MEELAANMANIVSLKNWTNDGGDGKRWCFPAFFGFFVKGGSLEIGRASTKAVVISCVMILFADYILSALLL